MANLNDFIEDFEGLVAALQKFYRTNSSCINSHISEPSSSYEHLSLYRWARREIAIIEASLARIEERKTNLTDDLANSELGPCHTQDLPGACRKSA